MPDLAMLDYFYGDEAEQFTFYRIPKVLFTDPSYRRISSDAKILYGLMLDRMGLSVRNGWLDEYNRVFIFFTLEDALEYLCCGHTKAVSLFGELDKAGLIERKKQGQGKPTKIYVKNFVRNAEVLTSEKRKSKVPQSGSQDFQKTASNNTEIKDTELSDTEPSIYPVRGLPEDKSPAADAMDTMRVYSVPDCLQKPYFQIKVQELLLFLYLVDVKKEKQREIYTSPQVEVVKEIHKMLISDLQKRPTIEELSKKYLINTATLKDTFKGIYGQPIGTYMKEYRIKQAAILLRQTQATIAEIANQVGYENQSKFATAFRDVLKIAPAEYRKQNSGD